MSKSIIFFFSLVISILVVYNAQGTTYYISPSGNDDNTGKSTDTPWATIARAFLAVSPGDTVCLRGGTYSGYANLYLSGTSDNPITFRNFSGETPVIDGSGKTTDPSNPWIYTNNLINIEASHIIFQGLELKNSAGFGIEFQQGSNYCIVDQCNFHNCYFAGVYFYKCSYGQVTNCIAHDFYDYGPGGTGGGGNADGIGSSAGNDKPYPDYGHHVFRNNLVYNCSDDGIDTWSSRGNIVENNIVHNAGFGNVSNGGSKASEWGKALGNGNGFKCGGASTSGNNIIRNNVSYGNVTSGFDENGGSGNKYYNNTSFNTVIGFRNLSPETAVNNLSYGNTINYSGGTQNNNSWDLGIANPNFISTDTTSADFLHLAAGSPAIDAGVDLSAEEVLTDRIGTSRPQGPKYDLGAYEYLVVSGILKSEYARPRIFPNPADEEFMMVLSEPVSQNTTYRIFNSYGRKVAESILDAGSVSKIINTGNYIPGIYFVQIQALNRLTVSKLIVAH